MSQLIEITCRTCGHKWWMDYDQLQEYKDIYKSVDKPEEKGAAVPPVADEGRIEEYRVRCPNPAHGEYVIVTLRISESDE